MTILFQILCISCTLNFKINFSAVLTKTFQLGIATRHFQWFKLLLHRVSQKHSPTPFKKAAKRVGNRLGKTIIVFKSIEQNNNQ